MPLSYAYPWLPSHVVCICALLHLLLHRATNLFRGILLSNPAWGRSSIADKWRYVLATSLSVLACLQEWLNVELSLLFFLFQNSGIGYMTASNVVAQGIMLCFWLKQYNFILELVITDSHCHCSVSQLWFCTVFEIRKSIFS